MAELEDIKAAMDATKKICCAGLVPRAQPALSTLVEKDLDPPERLGIAGVLKGLLPR